MLALAEVDRIAEKAASDALSPRVLSRVLSEATFDAEGRDALLVKVVLRDGQDHEVGGKEAVGMIVGINADLQSSGEDRFAIIEFLTESELRAVGERGP